LKNKGGEKMQINTITEFKSFINDLDLYNNYTKEFLHHMFKNKDRDFYILDLEKRKVIQTSQTFSLDSDWISHIEEITLFELYIEGLEGLGTHFTYTTVTTFRTLEDLKKVEQFIKKNFKFLKK
jgi:hypothetical protein